MCYTIDSKKIYHHNFESILLLPILLNIIDILEELSELFFNSILFIGLSSKILIKFSTSLII